MSIKNIIIDKIINSKKYNIFIKAYEEKAKKVLELNTEKENYKNEIKLLNKIISQMNRTSRIKYVGTFKNKEEEKVYIINDTICNTFYLYSINDNVRESSNNRLYYKIQDKIMIIIDFLTDENKGNGSLILENFIEFCKEEKMEKIIGSLSPVDNYNKDRRNHVYHKYGFNVTEESITLKLK